jgi:hypothetical protein
MMTHDPYQTYSVWGTYPGQTNPLAALQGGLNPVAGLHQQVGNPFATNPYFNQNPGLNPGIGQMSGIQQNPLQGYPGIPGYGGIHPQQLLAAVLLAQAGLYGGLQQNPLLGQQQNPFSGLHQQSLNPLVASNPILAQLAGQGLPPQTWLGQPQFGAQSQFGAQTPFGPFGQGRGLSPWGLPFAGF